LETIAEAADPKRSTYRRRIDYRRRRRSTDEYFRVVEDEKMLPEVVATEEVLR